MGVERNRPMCGRIDSSSVPILSAATLAEVFAEA
jgi:hypothetical protein